MLLTIFFIILLIWLVGMLTAFTLGGLIHSFLLLALVVLLVEFLERRKVL